MKQRWKDFEAIAFFNKVMDLFFKLLILFVIFVLGVGLFRLFLEIWAVMAGRNMKEAFGFTVTSLLTFFVVLELFKSLIEYFREHRLKLTFIVDATMVFILREVMIGLYQHKSSPWELAALGFLTLVLAVLRTLAIIYSPMEQRLAQHLRESSRQEMEKRPPPEPASPRETLPVH